MLNSLLIADDHNVVRETLVDYLQASLPGLVIHQAANFNDTWRMREHCGEPDALLIDWHMPGSSGLTGIRRTIETYPNSRVVIFSGEICNSDLEAARSLGVAGYIPKSYGARSVVESLDRLRRDGSCFPPDADACSRTAWKSGHPHQVCRTQRAGLIISPRQIEVLRLAAVGFLNKEIANRLSITEPTVKEHMSNILRSLRAKNRTDAARIARELSLI
ncbi:response regulator transcription factor [Nisaea sediminum]|uniref:response regulator transcription factor n=1 Tax=Nisaea sediminum TaxID=2775867 RepID=UPI001868E914|nr:response regulator transcription factor [Nisaea sediminum]